MEILVAAPTKPVRGSGTGASTLAAVDAYRNENVLYRFQTKLGLDTGEAELLFQDTKRFLYICASFPDEGPFSPTHALDNGWHEWLMFTKEYQLFCKRFFNKFIHHYPFVPGTNIKPGGTYRAYQVARRIFGGDLSANWMMPHAAAPEVDVMSNCSCGGSCGGGCNG